MPSQSNWLSGAQPLSPRKAPATSSLTPSASIKSHLTSKNLPPRSSYLTALISNLNPNQPDKAQKASAFYRILRSDLKDSLQLSPSNTFPADVLEAHVPFRVVEREVTVQVLSIEDIGRSRWSQVEAIESAERGEGTKGREVIRVVPGEEGLSDPEAEGGRGPHKLLVEDGRGVRVWAFEMSAVDGVGLGMGIGCKMVLRGCGVARGVVMLEAGKVSVLGGKVEEWNSAWKEGRKEMLKRGIDEVNGELVGE